MPTVALSPGHAFAGGFFVALYHDYRIQNSSKGFLCLNEIDIGMVIPTFMLSIVREKLGSNSTFRDAALEGRRFTGAEAHKLGIVDALGGLEDAIKFAQDKKLVAKARSGPWGAMKEDMYRATLEACRDFNGSVEWRTNLEEQKDKLDEARAEKVKVWEQSNKLSKL